MLYRNKKKQYLIILGDMVHTWEKVSVWVMPLNIGFIASYLKEQIPDEVEIRLFKRPDKIIDAIKSDKPDIIALSHYVWNVNLNKRIFEIARSIDKNVLNVGGGPMFTSVNLNSEDVKHFFSSQVYCDAFIIDQGEKGFVELVKRFIMQHGSREKIKKELIPGCIMVDGEQSNQCNIGTPLENIKNLDDIPSPYLTHLMDPFFEESYTPMIETTRSCPYKCTFCAFGIGTGKLSQFSKDRVLAEIDYIAEHNKKATTLFIADGNFSILERDIDIARHVYKCNKSTGFPSHVHVYWNKSNPERVLKAAYEMQGLVQIGASLQFLNNETLKIVKRNNLPLESTVSMLKEYFPIDNKMHFYSELIAGLPAETIDSHLNANRVLIDYGAEVLNYNLYLIPGTEIESEESRRRYFRKTGWRLLDNAYGVYKEKKVIEGQEIVLETSTIPLNEMASLRFLHFVFQFMWGKRFYYDFLMLFKTFSMHQVDVMFVVAEECKVNNGVIGEIHKAFSEDHALEYFETYEDLVGYWSQPGNFERLKTGDYGKLNFRYTYVFVLDYPKEFNRFLIGVSKKIIVEKPKLSEGEGVFCKCKDALKFCLAQRVRFNKSGSFTENHYQSFKYDILSWKDNKYNVPLIKKDNGKKFKYEFYLLDEQKDELNKLMKQYHSRNINLSLRKLSEYMQPTHLFYQVRHA